MSFASGKYAFSICDRCGDKIKYSQLRTEPKTKFRVCSKCLDMPHPQEYPTRSLSVNDPEALHDPRTDSDISANDGAIYAKDYAHGQTPIGLTFTGFELEVELGNVTVVVS